MGDQGEHSTAIRQFTYQHTTNTFLQILFTIQNTRSKHIITLDLHNLTKSARITAEQKNSTDDTFRSFYAKLYDPAPPNDGDFEDEVKYAIIEYDGIGDDFRVTLRSTTSESQVEDIEISIKESYLL